MDNESTSIGGTAAVALPREVAGVAFPRTSFALETWEFARGEMPEVLVNHVLRTYVFGAVQLNQAGREFDEELAFVACLLHDLGLNIRHRSADHRFEVDSADAAAAFLSGLGTAPEKVQVVWDAVALHTLYDIATRKQPEIAIVTLGSSMDFVGLGLDRMPAGSVDETVAALPRLGFKRDAMVRMIDGCATRPMAQIMHPWAEVGRRHIPDFGVPTLEDLIMAAPFTE